MLDEKKQTSIYLTDREREFLREYSKYLPGSLHIRKGSLAYGIRYLIHMYARHLGVDIGVPDYRFGRGVSRRWDAVGVGSSSSGDEVGVEVESMSSGEESSSSGSEDLGINDDGYDIPMESSSESVIEGVDDD